MPKATAVICLDTTTRMFSSSLKGFDGQPVAIANDIISGKQFMKVRQHMPWVHGRSHTPGQVKGELADLIGQGAVHLAHDDEHFRGVWVLADNEMESLTEAELRTLGDVERARTVGTVEVAPEVTILGRDIGVRRIPKLTRTALKKAAGKKAAAKTTAAETTAAKKKDANVGDPWETA
jgi:hypothetical protein